VIRGNRDRGSKRKTEIAVKIAAGEFTLDDIPDLVEQIKELEGLNSMNTPEPCVRCKNLYVDCLAEDDPTYTAECKNQLQLGKFPCPEFQADVPSTNTKVNHHDQKPGSSSLVRR